MSSFRALVVLSLATGLTLPSVIAATLPDYRLGDVAVEDIVTPVPLLVVNPEATDALKRKVAQQVHFVVRHTPQSAADAEAELRAAVNQGRARFLQLLQRELEGRAPRPTDLDTPAFENAVRLGAREMAKDLPVEKLAAVWVRGLSDDTFIAALLQPIRQVMAQPIVDTKTDSPLPANQPVRLIAVTSGQPPSVQELEAGGTVLPANKILSLWRARRLVETHFPAGQEDLGRFAASFVRTNAQPDPALTEIARARRTEGVTVNDKYEPAQVVVRRGQTIDRQALSALAMLREKTLIGTLQTKLDHEQTVAGQISAQTKWIAATLAAVCVMLVLVFWRVRSRPSMALVPLAPGGVVPLGTETADEAAWRQRALAAEGKAERAQAAIRSGALAWMRERIFRTLFRQRAELLDAQRKAEFEMRELEHRLGRLQTPLHERIAAYEKRIEELERELATKGEENRELIDARIKLAKQQLVAERERSRFGSN